jgi:hypothetical protein
VYGVLSGRCDNTVDGRAIKSVSSSLSLATTRDER